MHKISCINKKIKFELTDVQGLYYNTYISLTTFTGQKVPFLLHLLPQGFRKDMKQKTE